VTGTVNRPGRKGWYAMDAGRPGNRKAVLDSTSERAKLEQELARATEELAIISQKLEEKGDFGLG